ncbi:MAG: type II toxin-antitoxin system RelB/DinJ family antitoxin [bacterium]
MKTAVLHTRITPVLKNRAESILERIGLSSSDAIRIFFTQVVLHKGLPFDVSIPNKETAKVLQKSNLNIGVKNLRHTR